MQSCQDTLQYGFWNTYTIMYPNLPADLKSTLPLSVCYYTYCTNGCEKIGTQNHLRCKKYSYVLGSPVSQQHLESDGVDFQPGQVETILMHQFEYNGSRYINVFALVNWFAAHSMRFKFGKPLQLWSRTFYNKTFLPVCRIYSKFVAAYMGALNCMTTPMTVLSLYVH